MTRTRLLSPALLAGVALVPQLALAQDPPKPGIVYVPVEEITLKPTPCGTGEQVNSARNCTPLVTKETVVPAWGDAAKQKAVVDALKAALAPYNVRVTTERPPGYVPYWMIAMTDLTSTDKDNTTCLGSSTPNCEGLLRNGISLVYSKSGGCTDPDPVKVALRALGSMGGLEGTAATDDILLYPPDFASTATGFSKTCAAVTEAKSDCKYNHKKYCMGDDTQQNSHDEFLAAFGPAPAMADTKGPEVTSFTVKKGVEAKDGDTIQIAADESFSPSAKVTDDADYVFAAWRLIFPSTEVPDDPATPPDEIAKCTNKACQVSTKPEYYVPTATALDFLTVGPSATMRPGGTYTLELLVSDPAGNETKRSVTLEIAGADGGGGSGTDGGTASGGTDGGGGGSATKGASTSSTGSASGDTDTDTDGGTKDGDSKGCGCTAGAVSPAAGSALFALLGLGMAGRRRRRA